MKKIDTMTIIFPKMKTKVVVVAAAIQIQTAISNRTSERSKRGKRTESYKLLVMS